MVIKLLLKSQKSQKFCNKIETTGDLIVNKIANRITKFSKHSQQNNLFLFPNQPTKFRTKNWIKINDDVHGTDKKTVKLNLKLQC